MNRQRYQLVFNRHRGALMAVAETASTINGQPRTRPSQAGPAQSGRGARFSWLSFILALAMNTVAHAQILADRNAPRHQQATVLGSASGAPVVNIQTPNRAGLSVNMYRQFDVGSNGVVLNNARTTTQSQLAGYVAGNPWLATGAARVIVNQVNSSNPSYLRGFIEVAGASAQVIIANPSGITCAGCGFINAHRATLSTGAPVINRGNLESYRVGGGLLSIGSEGMDARRADYTDLIARAVQVNGSILANRLKVSAGRNTVSADHERITAEAGAGSPAPERAIDVAQLGGMYAGHIYLSATEHGVGVHNAGKLAAVKGTLVVTAAGRLENSGALAASGDAILNVQGTFENSGIVGGAASTALELGALDNRRDASIGSTGTTTLRSSGLLRNDGSLDGNAGLTLGAGALDNRGSITTRDALKVTVENNALNTGSIGATSALSLQAAQLENRDSIFSLTSTVDLSSAGQIGNTGRIEAATSMTLKSATADNSGKLLAVDAATLVLKQKLINSGEIGANRLLKVEAAALDNRGLLRSARGAVQIDTTGDSRNQGRILAREKITLRAAGIDNNGGTVAGHELVLDAGQQTLNNKAGLIAAQSTLRTDSAALDNRDGDIVSKGGLHITATELSNTGGWLQARSTLQLDLGPGRIENRQGLIRSDSAVTIQAQTLDNDDTQATDQGVEGNAVTITAHAVRNQRGVMRAGQSLKIVADGSVDNRNGLLSSEKQLLLTDAGSPRTLAIDNAGGRMVAGQELEVSAYSLSGNGKLLSQKEMRIDLGSDVEHHGEMVAGGKLMLRTDGKFTNAALIAAGGRLELVARSIDNGAQASLLGNEVLLNTAQGQSFTNRGLVDGALTRIQTGQLYNLGAGRIYGDHLAIGADVVNNRSEVVEGRLRAPVIAARNRLDIGAGVINNGEQALIYSVADMHVGATLDAAHKASGRAREVNNSSATINADGDLRIAAETINNVNAHLETTEETKPGRRIVRHRLNGSSQFIAGENALIYLLGDGGTLASESWRAMGDEDNFNLLLLSERYPFDKFGSPNRTAYRPPQRRGGEDSSSRPEEFYYSPDDPIWDLYGVARPWTRLGPDQQRPDYDDRSNSFRDDRAWTAARPAYLSAYLALEQKLDAYSSDFYSRLYDTWTIYDGTEQITRTVVKRSAPGMITSGRDMHLAAGTVNNYASQFIAGASVATDRIGATTINNTAPPGTQTVTSSGSAFYTWIKSFRTRPDDRRYDSRPYESQTIVTHFPLDITPTHGAGLSRQIGQRDPVENPTQQPAAVSQSAAPRVPAPDLSLPANALYQLNQSAAATSLVQTDPRFIGRRNWLSSDYLLRQWQDGAASHRGYQRFGDGFYEQQLIQRQIQEATGQRYLTGYNSNEAQYLALMQAGLQQAQQQRYALGIALTEAQIAELKTDIVWLVKRTVTLDDGSTREVLAPQVYLQPSSLQVSGKHTLIAGNDIALQTVQDLLNKNATITARQGVSLRADNINNLGGRISGTDVQLSASRTIEIAGGSIESSRLLSMRAGGDIAINSTSVRTVNATTSGANIDQAASVRGQEVIIAADGDLVANAAVIAAKGNATLAAGRDIRLGTVNENFREEITWSRGGQSVVTGSKDVVTQVSGNRISLRAGQDLSTQGSQVIAEGALDAAAARNVQIGSANESASARDQHERDAAGLLSTKTIRTDDASAYSRQVASTFSGDTTVVRAGNDLDVTASNIVSTKSTTLAATRNVNVIAGIDSSSQRNVREETTRGVMGAGIGFTIGSRMQSRDVDSQRQSASASTIGSVSGDVRIAAGNRYTQVGSDVLAPGGDIDIVAKTVSILAAQQASRIVTEDKFRQQGLTVSVSSPVLSAVQTIQQMSEAAAKTKDRRMKALAGATAGLSASNAVDAVIAGQGKTIDGKANQVATGPADPATGKTPTRDANAGEKVGGIDLSISLGASSSQARSEQISNTVRGSTVSAGGSVDITANGKSGDGNILIQGSDIKAGVNATLKATNEISLIAAQETSEQKSRNSSASGAVGFSIGTSGLLFTASASGSRGKAGGAEVTQVNSHVDAGNKVSLVSGTDTTLSGAVVRGRQVELDVGTSGAGNLNIASLQDTSSYQSRQQSLGGSVSIGMGKMGGSVNYSQSKINSNYASVIEQSGIKAGDGGFQVNVRGNTDLKGAVIASSDQAVAEGKNRLTTKTLTQSDIENKAEYKAQSIGINAGYSTGKDGGLSATPPLLVGASESSSSTTRSGISGGAITITDEQQQQALTGKTAEQTVASVNREVSSSKDGSNALKPIFDKEEIENRTAIASAFTRELGGFLNNRAKEADEAKRKLDDAIAEERAKPVEQRDEVRLRSLTEQYLDAEKWSPAGAYRRYTTAIVGAVTGNLAGSTSQLIQAATVNYLQGLGAEQVKKIADSVDSEPARVALQGVLGCAGALAKEGSCGAGALGASAAVVINALLQSAERPDNQEKESRKNLVTSIVAGIATAAGSKDSSTTTLAAQLEVENNALGTSYSKQFLNKIRACDTSTETCFAELKAEVDKQRKLFTEQLEKGCNVAAANPYACQAAVSSGQDALRDLSHALYFAKPGDQKEYVKALIAEQILDMDRQYPNLAALGERANHLDQLALQLQQMWADVGPAGASSGLISSGNAAISHVKKPYVPNAGAVGNMDQFFKGSDFGAQVRANTDKSTRVIDGQSVYVVKEDMGNDIKKGYQLYLDGKHKDHLEVFDKHGKFKSVLNLDGTLNRAKTNAAERQGRRLK
ncbi:hemagglutinin repeat-containing protein [Herbaspirillum seropedicae]|uniref:two-partner secretion domain-containing protein n=1 Tax=Herbaspirillum seropedicae TaxID=964 RepID=UPI0015DEFF5D|nr:hemagglutinin repeat-containing protein [Herbaspirillum seropedicae]